MATDIRGVPRLPRVVKYKSNKPGGILMSQTQMGSRFLKVRLELLSQSSGGWVSREEAHTG